MENVEAIAEAFSFVASTNTMSDAAEATRGRALNVLSVLHMELGGKDLCYDRDGVATGPG